MYLLLQKYLKLFADYLPLWHYGIPGILVYDPDLHSFFWLCLGFRIDTAGVII